MSRPARRRSRRATAYAPRRSARRCRPPGREDHRSSRGRPPTTRGRSLPTATSPGGPAAAPAARRTGASAGGAIALIVSSGSQSTIRPRSISATWSDTRSTSSSKCDEKRTVRPSSAIVRMIAARISRRTIGSSPVDGSSRTKSSGRYASAASSPTRARCPCESVLIRASGSRSNCRRRSSANAVVPGRIKGPQVPQQLAEPHPVGQVAVLAQVADPRQHRRPARAPGRARRPAPSRSGPSRDRAGA